MAERIRGRQWMRLREAALTRDRHLCQHCLADGRVTAAREVDHKVRLADGGTNNMENLQSLCGECHNIKTVGERGGKLPRRVGLDGYPVGNP